MELADLIAELSCAAAYPFSVDTVEVRQTHISVVFLAGQFVYKIKKPVSLGFLDFGTLERRRHFCQEELRLNRRLAPDVYLGVVPIAFEGKQLKFEAAGPVVEWAVKMERLSDDRTLESQLERGGVDAETMERLAQRFAAFHALAQRTNQIAAFGRFDVVARNARENLEEIAPHVGTVVSREVFDRLQALFEESLDKNRALIEQRAQRGVPCDTHGDLRLGHVYLFDEREPPGDMVVIDCIEFNERFRFADPVADMAFLAMGLQFHGRRDLAERFADAYFCACGDDQGRELLPFYLAYRSAVRGKVECLKAAEAEVPPDERAIALAKARGYWLLALGELEVPKNKPCLVLVAGLPGSGKSTLAEELAVRATFCVIRSDVVRKELAGATAGAGGAGEFGTGMYSPQWNERTYAACLSRAEARLFAGERVIVDASFRDDGPRQAFVQAAKRLGVPAIVLVCQAAPEAIRQRLANRHGDASDADWAIYRRAAEAWQLPGPPVRLAWHSISTDASRERVVEQALLVLGENSLYG